MRENVGFENPTYGRFAFSDGVFPVSTVLAQILAIQIIRIVDAVGGGFQQGVAVFFVKA